MKKRMAAALMAGVMLVSLGGCSTTEAGQTPSADQSSVGETQQSLPEETGESFIPGTYTGTGYGNNGEISVEVTVNEDEITDIQITDHHETYYMAELPQERIPQEILESQTLAVDTVAGATNTSNGIIRAVEDALVQAGADAESLYQEQPAAEKETETLNTQVIVVGAGWAGLNTALRLQDNGVDVILIEQLDIIGGSARFSGGGFMMGYDEKTLEEMKEYIVTRYYYGDFPVAEGTPDEERIMNALDTTQQISAWYEDLGVEVENSNAAFDYAFQMTLPPCYESYSEEFANTTAYITAGAWGVERLVQTYEDIGGVLMPAVKAASLIQDESGAVIGVNAEGREKDYVFYADAVVLATGSYTHNEELLEEYLPTSAGDFFATTVGADGSGIQMALDVGAVMTEDNYVNGGSRVANVATALSTTNNGLVASNVISADGMIVGRDGERLANEGDDRYFRYYTYEDENDYFFNIATGAMLDAGGNREDIENLVSENGPYYKADTLEELAAVCGLDEQKLLESAETFNTYCETGVDIFAEPDRYAELISADTLHSADDGEDSEEGRLSLDEGPYYAVKLSFVGFDIIGGLETGNEGQVLAADGEEIPGLYAVGFASSRDYMGSGAAHYYCLTICMASGVITADHLTEQLGQE